MFEIHQLLLISVGYFALLFLVGAIAERKWLPKKLTQHPIIYTLSLGAYAGAWALFGSMNLAQTNGFIFLAYFFGASALLIFAPLILQPILNLSKTYRLHSLADLLSFRYSSQWAGFFTTVCILISVLPLMAMQINTVADSALFLTLKDVYHESDNSGDDQYFLSLIFCLAILIFTIVYGSRQAGNEGRHEGLVVATAFQSLIKLCIFLTLGGAAMFMVFHSPIELESWLLAQPGNLQQLNESLVYNNARTLTLIFFSATLAMPHMYHLAITENLNAKSLNFASWAFPLYMLFLSLPILPILWAGQAMGLEHPAHYFSLAIGGLTHHPILSILAFICVLAAASASLIIITVSVSSMCMNHLFLPFYKLDTKNNIYKWLTTIKRIFMSLIMILAYGLYSWINTTPNLHNFGYASFTAAFQFLPGILAVLYWPRANRAGLLSGLAAGFIAWFILIFLPLVSPDALGLMPILNKLLNFSGDSYWTVAAIASLGVNMAFFGSISLLLDSDPEQQYVAAICSQDNLSRPTRQRLNLHSTQDFITALGQAIGTASAKREIEQALTTLHMHAGEARPFALRLLRRQIESNLTGLFGPTVARQIVAQHLPFNQSTTDSANTDIGLIEHRLEKHKSNLSGLAGELDELRRYHRKTIEDLPIGVCSLGNDNEILLWNKTIARLTGISAQTSIGSQLKTLPAPWSNSLQNLVDSPEEHQHKQQLMINGQQRWFTLHKTGTSSDYKNSNRTLLLEEVTSTALLEQELLHSERLASIGRLAAGVAHEIGNPITGIACLAQNLKYDSDSPAIHDAAKDILEQTQRVTRIVQSLVTFAHSGTHGKTVQHEVVNCYLCADDAVHLLSLEQKQLTESVKNNISDKHKIDGDSQRILQVFINLIKNAMDAGGEATQIILDSRETENTIEISISDNGPGIPAQVQEKIFEPFFTTKEPGEGTGLGLAMVYSIIEEHQGHIEITSPLYPEHGNGCRFTLQFPRHKSGIQPCAQLGYDDKAGTVKIEL